MKLCIVSDLHCKYQLDVNKTTETLLYSNMPRRPAAQHPVVAMLNAVDEDQSIKSNVLLCLGDLGDKADEQGIMSGWGFVEEIRQKIEAPIKIGIPGNHDMNSRKNNGKDAHQFIRSFHELFPTNTDTLNSKFWADGYCIQIHEKCLFLLLNTVHDHSDSEKAKISNIPKHTLESIDRDLKGID